MSKIKSDTSLKNQASHAQCSHGPDHGSHHQDSHSHGSSLTSEPTKIFKLGITLNLLFVAVEFGFGHWIQSLALISDAFHNLTDVFGLAIGWVGYSLAQKNKSTKYSITTALINSLLLVVGCIWLIFEAFGRFSTQVIPTPSIMMGVAFVGFIINFFSAKLFHKDHHHDLNMKSAYLHLMADAAISLGVVVTGAILMIYPTSWLDPVVSITVSLIVLYSAVGVARQSVAALKKTNI